MDNNIKVSVAHKILSVLYAVAILVGILFSFFEGYMLYVFCALVGLTILHYILGKGARLGRAWAKYFTIVIAALMLLSFPFGTMVGVYFLAYSRNWPAANKVTL